MQAHDKTKLVALLGTPLTQSYAAVMQNIAYEAMGEDMYYFNCEVDNRSLEGMMEWVRWLGFAGCAITKPNKIKAMDCLDEVDELCRHIGACNTAVVKNHRLTGYNTDAIGFSEALKEQYDAEGQRAQVFGAGGAGRAIAMALAFGGAKRLLITDPGTGAAQSLVQDLNAYKPHLARMAVGPERANLYVNASGLGMAPYTDESPMSKDEMDPNAFYFDACYNPAKTRFLKDAEERGARVMNGLTMSLYQGAAQIRLWSGEEAPVDVMRMTLQHILENT